MKTTIGVDEVGRGPIAGPVVVGAFQILDPKLEILIQEFSTPLHDSKQLSKEERELWFRQIEKWQQEELCDFAVSLATAGEVDSLGIFKATKKALADTLDSLEITPSCLILLDGSLKAPREFSNQITIANGDEREMAIALASIVAKVTRDRHMVRFSEKYPQYHFHEHLGYATESHKQALKKYGLSPIHRKSFVKRSWYKKK